MLYLALGYLEKHFSSSSSKKSFGFAKHIVGSFNDLGGHRLFRCLPSQSVDLSNYQPMLHYGTEIPSRFQLHRVQQDDDERYLQHVSSSCQKYATC
jgi:hypothetical protein